MQAVHIRLIDTLESGQMSGYLLRTGSHETSVNVFLKCWVLAAHRGGRMRILAAIEDPSLARKILDCLGLPSRPPPVAPARRNRHLEIAEL